MVTSKSPIVPTTWVANGHLSKDASEKVPMVTQLDEKRRHLWEKARPIFKRHKNGTRIL